MYYKFVPIYTDTFDVQAIEVTPGAGSVMVTCSFAEGSAAQGCRIVVSLNSSNVATRDALRKDQFANTSSAHVAGLSPGYYSVMVFDLEMNGTASFIGVLTEEVNITNPVPSSSVRPSLPCKLGGLTCTQSLNIYQHNP